MNTSMRAVKPLDKEITHYLDYLSTEQKKVVLSVVKNFTHEEDAWEEDKHFIAEMEKRFKDLESGKEKGITLEEMKTGVRRAYKNRKKKKA